MWKIRRKPLVPSLDAKIKLKNNLEVNQQLLQQALVDCADVEYRKIKIAGHSALLVFNPVMIDQKMLAEEIIKVCASLSRSEPGNILEKLKSKLTVGKLESSRELRQCEEAVLRGQAVLLVDGQAQALLLDVADLKTRAIEASQTEPSVMGSRDSFVESLDVNISLLRRRLDTPDFKLVKMTKGHKTQTKIAVGYLASVAHPALVKEVLRRLEMVKAAGLLDSTNILELIEDEPFSPFPTIQSTERPDKATAAVLEGRIVIMQDNSPFALLLPCSLVMFFQAVDDYYNRYFFGSFLRLLRGLAVFAAVYLPALYVAVTTFHEEMVPTALIIDLQTQREGVPFPALLEAILMGIAFEILREAGVRLPRPIGQAVSIVGALIIGESAVAAGLVSAIMVIVTALTAITSFALPSPTIYEPLFLLRIIMTVAGGVMGLWGIMIVSLLVLGHLSSLRSFGLPYLYPFSPLVIEDLDDILIRAPVWTMKKRPRLLAGRNIVRQGSRPSPLPNRGGGKGS